MPDVASEQEAAAIAQRFVQFWEAYPRKVGKVAAWKAWRRISPDQALLERMLQTLAWQKRDRQWREGFTPHPTTWLNQGRWLDEPFEPESSLLVSRRPLTKAEAISQANNEALRKVIERIRQRSS